jgi:YHS domain-containing protein
MGFLARVVRFLFWVLVMSWVMRLIGRAFSGAASQGANGAAAGGNRPQAGDEAGTRGGRLVKDPVCGMHLAAELALAATVNGEQQFFCSEECREKFTSGVLKRAANA